MTRTLLCAAALGLALAVSTASPATAAPPSADGAELAWTLDCGAGPVPVTAEAGPSSDRAGHDPRYTPVFTADGGVYVMVAEGDVTATFTDDTGNVVDVWHLPGGTTVQGGERSHKGGANAMVCHAVGDSTSAWPYAGHLHIELDMVLVAVGRAASM